MADDSSKAKTTEYVILRQTADGRWADVGKVAAASAMAAIREAAIKPAAADAQAHAFRDVYIAVPARSFQPVTAAVKREPSVTLKAVK